ncbi:Regulator of G-protein signaling rgs-11 [Caenorhabditis elegans]|uniref:Regulator of G-protein signaling rgs-11 n=1 Tax=Caenorhabditis elegans TaxID=6239 RepID=RGS11_CAEEL|nr:Regulator of G-protein signaling rgs-11 [Caenorhabditis elegans]O45524.1 RecName: Full=Regulator of G-protein signaling rgs-11 [Caenorhabditis elegans]CAB05728.1 Regulator of G-protein signaling rgs-11 [Caenorhabditis elegans]|eukprot:NP_510483.1 Regulator of G-protein signaling rgs-11 [Caenorhabditis elegans]
MSIAITSPCQIFPAIINADVYEKNLKVDDNAINVSKYSDNSVSLPTLSYEDFHHFSVVRHWNILFPYRLATEWNWESRRLRKRDALVILELVALSDETNKRGSVSRIMNTVRSKVHLMFSSSTELPSFQEIENWKKSPGLLAASKYGCALFIQFLKQQTSENEVDFWLDCQKFRSSTAKISWKNKEVHRILDQFLSSSAPRKIDMETSILARCMEYVEHIEGWKYTFDVAQAYVGLKFPKESHKKFLEDPLYLDLLELVISGRSCNKVGHKKSC